MQFQVCFLSQTIHKDENIANVEEQLILVANLTEVPLLDDNVQQMKNNKSSLMLGFVSINQEVQACCYFQLHILVFKPCNFSDTGQIGAIRIPLQKIFARG